MPVSHLRRARLEIVHLHNQEDEGLTEFIPSTAKGHWDPFKESVRSKLVPNNTNTPLAFCAVLVVKVAGKPMLILSMSQAQAPHYCGSVNSPPSHTCRKKQSFSQKAILVDAEKKY